MTEFLDGQYSIGQRILDADEFRGTIRYIGPVASAKKASDIWLGIKNGMYMQCQCQWSGVLCVCSVCALYVLCVCVCV
mgnify:FL=1